MVRLKNWFYKKIEIKQGGFDLLWFYGTWTSLITLELMRRMRIHGHGDEILGILMDTLGVSVLFVVFSYFLGGRSHKTQNNNPTN